MHWQWVYSNYLLLASSRSTTLPQSFFSTALARKNNCFCPWLSISSSNTASRPPRASITVHRLTAWRASMMALSGYEDEGSMFWRIVPGRTNWSWATVMRRERRTSREMMFKGMESMVRVPADGSSRRRMVRRRDDFPLQEICIWH